MKKLLSSACIFVTLLFALPQEISFLSIPMAEAQGTDVPTRIENPSRVFVPAIRLNSPIEHVGLDSAGRMAVPDGATNNVGWYSQGTRPGGVGSAVLAAHVYAAFEDLHEVKIGDEIFVEGDSGARIRFVVQEIKYFRLSELAPDELFNKDDARRLTLITCAGFRTFDGTGYSHRLVVYAVASP